MDGVTYSREVLIEVIVYHYRKDISSCGCGWSEIGKSHPEHIADVYEASVKIRNERVMDMYKKGEDND